MFFYRHTRAASYIRGTLHRYSAFPYVLRILYTADLMIGAALWNVQQTGVGHVVYRSLSIASELTVF